MLLWSESECILHLNTVFQLVKYKYNGKYQWCVQLPSVSYLIQQY